MYYPINDYRNYLEHHGIAGQKWGVRKAPWYPISEWKESVKAKRAEKKAAKDKKNLRSNKETSVKSTRSTNNSLNKPLSKKYNNLTDDQKRKMKRAAIAVGALALTAAVGYAAYRGWSAENLDKVIKSGTNLHTITANKNKNFDKAFYAAYKTSDRIKYKGMLGMAMMGRNGTTTIYDHTNILSENVKIPSPKNATKILSDLIDKDKEFESTFKRMVNEISTGTLGPKQRRLILDVKNGLAQGRNDQKFMRKAYDAYNFCLVAHDNGGAIDKNHDQFYKKLAQLGYGAIVDVNDRKYSGYKSKAPLIVFNAGITADKAAKELGIKDVAINAVGADVLRNYKMYAAKIGSIGLSAAVIGGTYGVDNYNSKSKKKNNKQRKR